MIDVYYGYFYFTPKRFYDSANVEYRVKMWAKIV